MWRKRRLRRRQERRFGRRQKRRLRRRQEGRRRERAVVAVEAAHFLGKAHAAVRFCEICAISFVGARRRRRRRGRVEGGRSGRRRSVRSRTGWRARAARHRAGRNRRRFDAQRKLAPPGSNCSGVVVTRGWHRRRRCGYERSERRRRDAWRRERRRRRRRAHAARACAVGTGNGALVAICSRDFFLAKLRPGDVEACVWRIRRREGGGGGTGGGRWSWRARR